MKLQIRQYSIFARREKQFKMSEFMIPYKDAEFDYLPEW